MIMSKCCYLFLLVSAFNRQLRGTLISYIRGQSALDRQPPTVQIRQQHSQEKKNNAFLLRVAQHANSSSFQTILTSKNI